MLVDTNGAVVGLATAGKRRSARSRVGDQVFGGVREDQARDGALFEFELLPVGIHACRNLREARAVADQQNNVFGFFTRNLNRRLSGILE